MQIITIILTLNSFIYLFKSQKIIQVSRIIIIEQVINNNFDKFNNTKKTILIKKKALMLNFF